MLLVFVGLTCVACSLLVWAAARETAADREIQRIIDELRARGEPIDARDLDRLFPDPPATHDAHLVFAAAAAITSNAPSLNGVPLMDGATLLPNAGTDLEETARDNLRRYCHPTDEITNALAAPVPAGTQFAARWHTGLTNGGAMNFVRIRHLTQMMAAHALEAAELRDADRAALLLERNFQLAGAIRYENLLVSHMIRHACENLGVKTAERALSRLRFTDEQLRRLNVALLDEAPGDLANTMRGEHCLAIWAFQKVKDGMPLDNMIWPNRISKPWWERWWKRLHRKKPEYADADFIRYLQTIPRQLELARLPLRQALTNAHELQVYFATNAVSEIGEGTYIANWKRALAAHAESRALVSTAKLAFAVERYRLAHGDKLPDSLDALVSDYITAVPRDPFDDQPLHFKKLQRGYVVYSIGPDGIDDGGMAKTNLLVTTNYDVTFTVER